MSPPPMISAVVLTKNEEKNIEDCLKTLKWCDELVVVDDHSTDQTVAIARKLGAKIFVHLLDNNFAVQRNYGLQQAQGEWVLFVDADERITPQLRAEIQSAISNQQPASPASPRGEPAGGSAINGFYLRREDKLWGRTLKHGETQKVRLLRLGRKSAGQWEKPVHEVWKIGGAVRELSSPLIHYPHPTASEFLQEINFYSSIRAHELYDQKRKTNLLEILTYPIAKFFKNYFFNLGILDGMGGFLVALVMSFHSFLVRSKLYLLWRQKAGWQ